MKTYVGSKRRGQLLGGFLPSPFPAKRTALLALAVLAASAAATAGPPSAFANDAAAIAGVSGPPEADWWTQRALVMSEKLQEAVELKGRVSQETAYRISNPREFTKIRQNLWLTQSADLAENARFTSTQWLRYDAVFDLTSSFPETVESDEEFEVELRETYLDLSFDRLDARLGKQTIVWGESVGLFFADIVNAKDLREFVLQDFDRIRIPQWAVDLETTVDDFYAEFVWIPVLKFHRLGVSGSDFEFPYPVAPGAPFTTVDPSKPPSSFNNSEVGGRVGYLVGGWDIGAFYLYSWNKYPVMFRSLAGATSVFRPEYRRQHYAGMSFSKEIEPVVLRGEMLVAPEAYLSTLDPTDADGVIRRTTVDYVLGASTELPQAVELNFQFMQRLVHNWNSLLADEHEARTFFSFLLGRDFMDGRVRPEVLTIVGMKDKDLLVRPLLNFNVTDDLTLRAGADIMQGDPKGIFGRFDQQSRIYTEVEYFF